MSKFEKKHLSWIGGVTLICSFLGALLFGVFDSSKDTTVVKFKSLGAIQRSDFENKVLNSKDSQKDRLDLLGELVEERIIDDFISSHAVQVSDGALKQFLSKNLIFRGKNGDFDESKFQSYLTRTKTSESSFMLQLRKNLITQCVFQSLCFVPSPKFLVTSLQSHDLETRKVILGRLAFNHKVKTPISTQQDLRDIYLLYQKEFLVPETRSIHYCVVKKPSIENISNQEIFSYLKKNRASFGEKKLVEVEKSISQLLLEEKRRNLEAQIIQSTACIESSEWGRELGILDDVVKKYKVKRISIADASFDKISRDVVLGPASREIFNTPKERLGSPFIDKDHIVIWFIRDIKPVRMRSFDEVKQQVIEKFVQIQRKIANEKLMESFVLEVNNSKEISKKRFEEIAAFYGVDCSRSYEVNNSNNLNPDVPYFMIESIYNTKLGHVTPVFSDQDGFLVAFVECKRRCNPKLVSLDKIEQKLRNNLFMEIYSYLYRKAEPVFVAK